MTLNVQRDNDGVSVSVCDVPPEYTTAQQVIDELADLADEGFDPARTAIGLMKQHGTCLAWVNPGTLVLVDA